MEDQEQQKQLTIVAADFNQLLADDGVATFIFTPSGPVNNFGTGHFLTVELVIATTDNYQFSANEGDVLSIVTTTPGDGPGEPLNSLDPSIELFFDSGSGPVSVATGVVAGDGRNEHIDYTVPSGAVGTYFLTFNGNVLCTRQR